MDEDIPLPFEPATEAPSVPVADLRRERLVGTPTPRLSTPNLRPLTRETSKGYALCDFAEHVLGQPFLPWQRELAIRALELRPDGGRRFRTVVVVVGRQNGKSQFLKTLALWSMYVERAELVLGTAQNLAIAREMWLSAIGLAKRAPALAREIVTVRTSNVDPQLLLRDGQRYKISAAIQGAARGLTVDLLLVDEIREMVSWEPWAAMSGTTRARADAQIWCVSNAGHAGSVVLNQLRANALAGLDESLGLFEWSAPDGMETDNEAGWCQANPGLGHTVSEAAIRSALGTDPPNVFRAEVLAQFVQTDIGAFDLEAWKSCADPAGSLAAYREGLCAGVDVAVDGSHVSLVAASKMPDGRVRVETVAAWWKTADAVRDLPALIGKLSPRQVAWLPGGPAAALAPFLSSLPGSVEVTGAAVSQACMSMADLVQSRRILHNSDALLDAQVAGAAKMATGDGYRFSRKSVGTVDSCYAAAVAIRAALTLAEPVERPRALWA